MPRPHKVLVYDRLDYSGTKKVNSTYKKRKLKDLPKDLWERAAQISDHDFQIAMEEVNDWTPIEGALPEVDNTKPTA